MAYLLQNERTKLSATLLNTIAAASIVVGGVTPVVALGLGGGSAQLLSPRPDALYLVVPAWIGVGIVLHFLARITLRGLRE